MGDGRISTREIIEQAADWRARLAADDVPPDDWHDLKAWLDADAAHRKVFDSMGQMSGGLRALGNDPRLRALHDSVPAMVSTPADDHVVPLHAETARRTWNLSPRHMALAAGVLVALMVPLLFFMANEQAPDPEFYEARIGERRDITLDDGSALTLNADSRISVVLSDDERQLELRRGQVFVEVAPNPDRPFHVVVGTHRVTALGTAFDVLYRDDPPRVTVLEGRVRVVSETDTARPQEVADIAAGQRLVLVAGANPTTLSEDALERESDWRNGWLHFDNESLANVVKELGPFVDKRIVLGDGQTGQLKVGGSFNVDQLDSIWSAMESVVPVEISETNDQVVIRQKPR